jgi:hypothetical protein
VGIGYRELLIILAVLTVLIFGPIVRKAGFSRWLSLLLLVPIVNIVFIWIFAFIKWPSIDDAM